MFSLHMTIFYVFLKVENEPLVKKNTKTTLLWILELKILTISLILKNVHRESAVIIPETFQKIFICVW